MPKSEWLLLEPVKGPSGASGMKSWGDISAATSISSKSENKEAAMKFLDYLITDEGFKLSYLGIKDVHWIEKDGKFSEYTADGKKAVDEKWLDPLSALMQRTDIVMKEVNGKNASYATYIEGCNSFPIMHNIFNGITTNELQTLGGELTRYEMESMIQFVTGVKDIDKEFDNYIKQWKEKGGEEIRQSQLKAYNEIKGTSLVFDN